MLLHLDFIRPEVKAIFRAIYDIGDVPRLAERREIHARFHQFWEKLNELGAQGEHRDDILWTKNSSKSTGSPNSSEYDPSDSAIQPARRRGRA